MSLPRTRLPPCFHNLLNSRFHTSVHFCKNRFKQLVTICQFITSQTRNIKKGEGANINPPLREEEPVSAEQGQEGHHLYRSLFTPENPTSLQTHSALIFPVSLSTRSHAVTDPRNTSPATWALWPPLVFLESRQSHGNSRSLGVPLRLPLSLLHSGRTRSPPSGRAPCGARRTQPPHVPDDRQRAGSGALPE